MLLLLFCPMDIATNSPLTAWLRARGLVQHSVLIGDAPLGRGQRGNLQLVSSKRLGVCRVLSHKGDIRLLPLTAETRGASVSVGRRFCKSRRPGNNQSKQYLMDTTGLLPHSVNARTRSIQSTFQHGAGRTHQPSSLDEELLTVDRLGSRCQFSRYRALVGLLCSGMVGPTPKSI